MDAEADREESWVREQMQQHPGLAEEARAPAPPPHRHTATPPHHTSSLSPPPTPPPHLLPVRLLMLVRPCSPGRARAVRVLGEP